MLTQRQLTTEQKVSLSDELYQKSLAANESLEYCNLGVTLFYLIGAIMGGDRIQLDEFDPQDMNTKDFLQNNFDQHSEVWNFIEFI